MVKTYKKFIFFSFFSILFFVSPLISKGQDILIKKNGDELKVKVTEINQIDIIFIYSDSLSGPLYIISKSEVFMIKFSNGVKEVFDINKDENYNDNQGLSAKNRIEIKAGKYYHQKRRIGYSVLFNMIETSNNHAAIIELEIARRQKKLRSIFLYSSFPLAYAGLGFLINGLETASYGSYDINEGVFLTGLGVIGILGGGTLLSLSIKSNSHFKMHLEKAIKLYNKS